MPRCLILPLFLVRFISTISAQALTDVPQCSAKAALTNISQTGCEISDLICVCKDQIFVCRD